MSLPIPSELATAGFLSLLEKNHGGVFVLYGHPEVSLLAQKLLVLPLSIGHQTLVLDTGNVFDPYLITRMAQTLGKEPRELLSRILISRSFTCHQTHALAKKVAALNRTAPPFILVLGLLATFYDEEIAFAERRALLQKTLGLLKGIADKGAKVLVTATDPPMTISQGLDSLLIKSADRVARVQLNSDGSLHVDPIVRNKDTEVLRR